MKQAVITEVMNESIAEELGLLPGDKILSINNNAINDLIDFHFFWSEEDVELLVEKKSGEKIVFEIEKDFDEGLGIKFESAVFDKIIKCQNKCLFCFIDQMGPSMRKSLYVKDDDYRLSFLQGNFITLTNLNTSEIEKIKRLHLSPLYISVHTTDSELRATLLNNKHAANIKDQLKSLAEAGIEMHTQIVLCPGINDKIFLEQTIDDLVSLYPQVCSIAIVPVGVTKYRKNLHLFPEITKEYALSLINNISKIQKRIKEQLKKNIVYLADEIFIKAEVDFPNIDYYGSFPQIENGVGMSRLLIDEFEKIKAKLPKKVSPRKYTIITGKSGSIPLQRIITELQKIQGLELKLKVINNTFFGSRVTVTGLLTGSDLLFALCDLERNTKVLFPDVMLKEGENIFLDGLTPDIISRDLKIEMIPVKPNALDLINILLKEESGD